MTNILSKLFAMLGYFIIGIDAIHTYNASTLQPRSADTCADPSLAGTFIEAFNSADVAHAIANIAEFVGSGAGQDYLFTLSTDSNPPSVPGYTQNGIVGYVYATQECGSVPLLAAFNQALGDHYYTTVVNDHSRLIGISGWVDAGIAAYVLPLSSNCSCSS